MMDPGFVDNDCLVAMRSPILQAIARTESSFNPFAIGVVNGRLQRQPRTKQEAIATALDLKAKGFNYSMGCLQINQANLKHYGLTHETVFEAALNVRTGAAILDECYVRAVRQFGDGDAATNAALSCYYSGNFKRGLQKEGQSSNYADLSYAQKVKVNMPVKSAAEPAPPIPVIANKLTKPRPLSQEKKEREAGHQSLPSTLNDDKQRSDPVTWDVFGDIKPGF